MTTEATASAGSARVLRRVLRRVLHLSDIHCGSPFVAEQVAAAEHVATSSTFDAIVISGDFAQRARVQEFERAREILMRVRAIAPTLVVPGNHDTAWWHAPFGYGDASRLHANYRAFISEELEPTLRVPGVSVIGLNSAAGTLPQAVTWYPRDWRVKGGLTDAQMADAHRRLADSPADDLRIVVLHHNVVRGDLSNRWGLKRPQVMLDAIAAASPHVVCTGHDHQERIEIVTRSTGRFLVSTANTLSNRMRGHRPSSLNVIESDATSVRATAWVFRGGVFEPSPMTATLDL